MAAGHAPRMPDAIGQRAPATRTVGPGSMTVCWSASRRAAALRPRLRGGGPEPHEGGMLSPSLPSAPAYAGAEGLVTSDPAGQPGNTLQSKERPWIDQLTNQGSLFRWP